MSPQFLKFIFKHYRHKITCCCDQRIVPLLFRHNLVPLFLNSSISCRALEQLVTQKTYTSKHYLSPAGPIHFFSPPRSVVLLQAPSLSHIDVLLNISSSSRGFNTPVVVNIPYIYPKLQPITFKCFNTKLTNMKLKRKRKPSVSPCLHHKPTPTISFHNHSNGLLNACMCNSMVRISPRYRLSAKQTNHLTDFALNLKDFSFKLPFLSCKFNTESSIDMQRVFHHLTLHPKDLNCLEFLRSTFETKSWPLKRDFPNINIFFGVLSSHLANFNYPFIIIQKILNIYMSIKKESLINKDVEMCRDFCDYLLSSFSDVDPLMIVVSKFTQFCGIHHASMYMFLSISRKVFPNKVKLFENHGSLTSQTELVLSWLQHTSADTFYTCTLQAFVTSKLIEGCGLRSTIEDVIEID
ncbi:hypothetical protein P9112_002378 [Eukaryota sp. TZLM1-RC]